MFGMIGHVSKSNSGSSASAAAKEAVPFTLSNLLFDAIDTQRHGGIELDVYTQVSSFTRYHKDMYFSAQHKLLRYLDLIILMLTLPLVTLVIFSCLLCSMR